MKPLEHVVFILNPYTVSSKRQKALLNQIPQKQIWHTEKPGHATTLTQQALSQGFHTVVAVGGDGTLNEVLNGFFKDHKVTNPQAVLATLPWGTGCDFARAQGMTKDLDKFLEGLQNTQPKNCDVGYIEFKDPHIPNRYFINIANIGLVASITKTASTWSRWIPAQLRYAFSTVMCWLSEPPFDNNIKNLTIANSQAFGCGLFPAPQAKIDDGLLDIITIPQVPVAKLLMAYPGLFTKKTGRLFEKLTTSKKTHSLNLPAPDSKKTLYVEMDGDVYGTLPATVSCLPGAIRLMVLN